MVYRKGFGRSLTDAQVRLARVFERAGLTTYSQAVKAFERDDHEQIQAWKQQLEQRQQKDKQ